MAKLLLAAGTSLSPLLTIPPEYWPDYCKTDMTRKVNRRDGSSISYEELRAQTADRYASQVTPAAFRQRAALARGHLRRIAAALDAANPDVVVVVADDRAELFDGATCPAIAVYRGAELTNSGIDRRTALFLGADNGPQPAWRRGIHAAQALPAERHYPGHPAFADSLTEALIGRDVDVAVAAAPRDPADGGVGFAWGFVINQLLGERRIPVVPVMLNTWFAPNVPTPGRCFRIGRALRAAISEVSLDMRVAVVCGGGMSHVGIDPNIDRRLLDALLAHDAATLGAIPRAMLISGTCQLLTWILLAGLVDLLENDWLEYLPVYRTAAGTGIGMAFGCWS
ncbi:MAG: hypothetical protein WDO72_04795 [Pseudomonadota bacterium]